VHWVQTGLVPTEQPTAVLTVQPTGWIPSTVLE